MNVRVGQTSTLCNLTLTEAADAVARGEITSVELTRSALSAIAARDKAVNSFIWLDEEDAMTTAAALDAMRRQGRCLGSLHGVPLAHKDMYYRAGKRSTCGSKIRADFRPSYTATVIDRLEGAGSISIGGLNMAEFAQNATGHNAHYGHCGNPWNVAYCPGGSSSGSGASVGARLIYAALGSDTGGSIRLPASLCGVTGIKDNVGPLARSARDCARIMTVIAGHDPRDPTSSSEPVPDYEAALTGDIRGMTIGVPTNYFLDDVDPDVMAAFEAAVDVLKERGAVILPVTVPHMDAIATYGSILSRVEGAAIHAQWMRERPEDYAIHLNARLYASYGIPATIYIEALARRGELLKAVASAVFSKAAAFVVPTIRIKAPTLKQADIDAGADGAIEFFNKLSVNTRPMNYLGLPSVSLPIGLDFNGLPMGLQIQGRPFSEGTILRIADAFQRSTNHHRKLPPMLS
jgi:aspartyl-tRNA(Asn)/glutamyl-tRNA(Gln) amidotransferase subunit A